MCLLYIFLEDVPRILRNLAEPVTLTLSMQFAHSLLAAGNEPIHLNSTFDIWNLGILVYEMVSGHKSMDSFTITPLEVNIT